MCAVIEEGMLCDLDALRFTDTHIDDAGEGIHPHRTHLEHTPTDFEAEVRERVGIVDVDAIDVDIPAQNPHELHLSEVALDH
jgi:hypothetical protein